MHASRMPGLRNTAGYFQGSVGCSSDAVQDPAGVAGSAPAGAAGSSGNVTAPEGDRRTPYTPVGDAQFAAFFVEHHRMAIDMATMEAKHGASAEVKALASNIADAQATELKTLEAALADSNESLPPAAPADPHVEADMAEMSSLTGTALDMMFLMDMIPHHAAGLAPARRALASLRRPELVTLAKSIFSKQSEEIGTMRQMLTDMGSADAGEDPSPDPLGAT